MATVFDLLTLPKTSKGFTLLRSSIVDSIDDGSASPPRKTRRLDADSDSTSASRSKRSSNLTGPIKIEITGEKFPKPSNGDAPFALVRRSLNLLLDRGNVGPLPSTYEGIYTACRFVVTVSNMGEGLYGTLKMELERSIGQVSRDLAASTEEGMNWIAEFVKVCHWFETQVALLQSLLTYLDQVYVVSDRNAISVHTLAYSLFTVRIFENLRIATRLRDGISEWVTWERKFRLEHEHRQQIRTLITQLITHKQYSAFEEYYANTTASFYSAESAEYAQAMKKDPQEFFKHAHLRIEEEDQRSKDALPVGSWSRVREITEQAIWSGRLEWIASETIGVYIDTKDIKTLATMYTLFSRVDGLKVLCAAFRAHVQSTVQTIVKDVDMDEKMVQRLLDFKALADNAISAAFADEKINPSTSASAKLPNNDFIYALSDAFTMGFKARRNKPAEMIAKYVDKAMRRGQGASTDADFEALLDAVLALYRFTDDKDVFRTFYHRALAKRLLLEKSASDDFEAAMLKKLKEKYDPEFGMGEEMFKDLALSKESMRDYHSKLDSQSAGLKLSVMVLQRSAWPFTVQNSAAVLPPSMQAELQAYENYYKQRHSGHTISWILGLGSVTMKARFTAASKELSLSLYQAIVLLLFNNSAELAYPEILDKTGMAKDELERTLQSLACGKKKVIKKSPPGRDINEDDVFYFNNDFEDPRAKVHINSIQAKVSPEESRRTNVSIEGDRKHYLDAAIVRIMKARKEMTYEQLKAATIEAVKSHFVPQVDAIKKRIDSLVETDYLERSKVDKTKFLYVA